MEDLAAGFCRGAKERTGLRYPEELRQLAVEYAQQARGQGHSWRLIAERLGLSEWSLHRWLRRSIKGGESHSLRVHEVRVTEQTSASQPVLVMPSGARVEGLSMRDLVALLGAIG
jgi:transposase-like protein